MHTSSYVPVELLVLDQYVIRRGYAVDAMSRHDDLLVGEWGDAYTQDYEDASYCMDAPDRSPAGSHRRGERRFQTLTVFCLASSRSRF